MDTVGARVINSALTTDPPIGQIAAALRKTTETIAVELAVPTGTVPIWSEFEWRIARAASAMHGVSSLLYAGLRWEGPQGWKHFLREQRDQSIGRHRQIVRLLNEIDLLARREGIAVVALKGAALHANGIYEAGERPMGDIDLLIRSNDANAVASLLEACDYEEAYSSRRHLTFRPRSNGHELRLRLGEHIDNPIKIEVHSRIAERLPQVDITSNLFPIRASSGINAYPSPAALMKHLLLHAAGNMRARALRLIQLHDISLLARRFNPGDWNELIAAPKGGLRPWWAWAPLTLTARYYPGVVDSTVLESLKGSCPGLLRSLTGNQRLADVSWSNIRIAAFPGIEWSRTPQEAMGFMKSRIWPDRESRSELHDGAAQVPGVSTIPWYGISHGARIMRWVFSRPPRVQTLLSVRAALAEKS
jgi:hypothetical protein